jgi:hypothetical protein
MIAAPWIKSPLEITASEYEFLVDPFSSLKLLIGHGGSSSLSLSVIVTLDRLSA